MKNSNLKLTTLWKPLIIGAAVAFLYSAVLIKLGRDWWSDENYSHGLLIPFVIGYILWLEFGNLRNTVRKPQFIPGLALVLFSLLMLLLGTLGAELFTQRVSLAVMLAGITIYFFGTQILRLLAVPFALLLFAIPIPTIIFNKIAMPLQAWATQAADWGIGLFGIASVRKGNVIELIPRGETLAVGLEVVEACSGIRSLMTLVTLALILGYFTREQRGNAGGSWLGFIKDQDFWHTIILMLCAFPIALVTNALRVMTTGILTYYYGPQMADGLSHDASGWAVYLAALILLISINLLLKKFIFRSANKPGIAEPGFSALGFNSGITSRQTVVLFIVILIGGVFINWFERRGEVEVERISLVELPKELGIWQQRGMDTRFNAPTESVLRASDYVMRDYGLANRKLNLYIGYYASQRTGATYHSPLNCLPGSGWEMSKPGVIEIETPSGKTFMANRYIVQQGDHKELIIYWYLGRGRTNTSEYRDKAETILDSMTLRRSDGGMVRVMTPIGGDEEEALIVAADLSAEVAEKIAPFVPD